MKKIFTALTVLLLSFSLFFASGCQMLDQVLTKSSQSTSSTTSSSQTEIISDTAIDFESAHHSGIISIPNYDGSPYFVVNNNEPFFKSSDKTTTSFENFDELDSLGRCGETYACVGKDIMPTEERGEIGQVKPTGWQTVKYDCVSGKYLYNRCHLIGFQLTGENANDRNLITGTRYMNVDGMLPFEDMVADYVKETLNHVLYRVTPIFKGNNLVAHGVLMEAYSVEDNGEGITFNVYCYNVQPQIAIDYATGNSALISDGGVQTSKPTENSTVNSTANSSQETSQDSSIETSVSVESSICDYVLNKNSKIFHLPTCSGVSSMSQANRQDFTGTREELISQGYKACGTCHP